MKVIFKNSFLKDVHRIKERTLALHAKEVLESVERAATLQEIANFKQLKGSTGYYRIRVGDYRTGLRVDGETITLVRFLHRKEGHGSFGQKNSFTLAFRTSLIGLNLVK